MDFQFVTNPTYLSLKISFCSVVLEAVPALIFGWIIAKSKLRFSKILDLVVMLPVVLTPLVVGFFLLEVLSPSTWIGKALQDTGIELLFNWKGAIIAVSGVSFPLFVQSAIIAFDSIDTRLSFAAQNLGSSSFESFIRVILPLSWRGLLSGASLAFARNMGEFGATSVVSGNIEGKTETLPLAIYRYINTPGSDSVVYTLVGISILTSCIAILVVKLLGGKNIQKAD